MNKKMKDVMTKDVQVIPPECSVEEAAQAMKDLNIGLLPVCDGNRILGALTDRDIAVRVVAEGKDPQFITVGEVMTSPVVYCWEDQEIEDAARIMEAKQIRRLVVINQDNRLAGIVSLGDLALKAGKSELAREILEKVSEPVRGQMAA